MAALQQGESAYLPACEPDDRRTPAPTVAKLQPRPAAAKPQSKLAAVQLQPLVAKPLAVQLRLQRAAAPAIAMHLRVAANKVAYLPTGVHIATAKTLTQAVRILAPAVATLLRRVVQVAPVALAAKSCKARAKAS